MHPFNVGDMVRCNPRARDRGFQYMGTDGTLRPVDDEWSGTITGRARNDSHIGESGFVVVTPPLYKSDGREMKYVGVGGPMDAGSLELVPEPEQEMDPWMGGGGGGG